MPSAPAQSLQTRVLHADAPDFEKEPNHPAAPIISLSTTFRHPHPDTPLARTARGDMVAHPEDPPTHVYSRYTQGTNVRTEKVLTAALGGYALTYSSGLNAALAALTALMPATIAIRKGYFGVHEVVSLYSRGRDVKVIDLDDEYPSSQGPPVADGSKYHTGATLVWLETPLNPTGEARDIEHYAKRAHDAGGYITVDATFAPPPLQNPFNQQADIVMHSASKYLGGHTDVLSGVLATQEHPLFKQLWAERAVHGGTLGSLESFLLLRSLRTLPLRVRQQSKTAMQLAHWLHSLTAGQTPLPGTPSEITGGNAVRRVWHSSLQPRSDYETELPDAKESRVFDPKQQMPGGGSPTFGVLMKDERIAKYLPHTVELFVPATSLGGVESLMEQREISSPSEDPRVVRISIGLEEFDDLRADVTSGLIAVLQAQ
ncbi:cystathionine gamma-synthase [Malassezia sp. CBS 17886]|nr:cystathionine gamma-synthase [Malassezia sp. CBS 17886]